MLKFSNRKEQIYEGIGYLTIFLSGDLRMNFIWSNYVSKMWL
jgi:hypothetical protein